MDYAVELKNITKTFEQVLAVHAVSMSVERGTIHSLVGENGAGKTTLMNVLYGMYKPDSGSIYVNGDPVEIEHPAQAISLGLGCVHQEFMLAPTLTVVENVIIGRIPGGKSYYTIDSAISQLKGITKQYGMDIDLSAKVQDLSVGAMQSVEMLKALYRGADILILDEPTAVLTPGEVNTLFETIRILKSQGKTIIFITHKLGEVMEISDWVTVLRGGRVTGDLPAVDVSISTLVELMVGNRIQLSVEHPQHVPGDEIVRVTDLSVQNDRGVPAVDNFCLAIRTGEILGLAGVEGNGQVELVEALLGFRPITDGKIVYKGRELRGFSPRERRELGIAYIPENRLRRGTSVLRSVLENLTSLIYYKKPYSNRGILDPKELIDYSEKLIQRFDIRVPDSSYKVSSLSGGNIQRLILARELATAPELLIASQPTRGLDIAAKKYIHNQLVESRSREMAVLLISADLDEIMDISDRIIVMYRGKNVREFTADEADKDRIGYAMAGGDARAEVPN